MKRYFGRSLRAVAAAILVVSLLTGTASAHSASQSTYFPNGTRLTANIWIQSIADLWSNCGDFQSSSVISAQATWIKNTVTLTAYGVGASVSAFSLGSPGGTVSASWTNYYAYGSYLSGRVCANWLTWYVGAGSTATAYHYGTVRIVSVSV